MGCWGWLKTQPSGLAFSVKTPRATPLVFWLQKPVPRAGFSAKPSTSWLKPILYALSNKCKGNLNQNNKFSFNNISLKMSYSGTPLERWAMSHNLVHFHAPFFTNHVYFTSYNRQTSSFERPPSWVAFIIRTLHDCPSQMNENLLISNSKLTSDSELIWWR